jgi:DNA-binding MarR family transcriptional regulator
MSTVPDRQHAVNHREGVEAPRSAAGDAFSGLVIRVFRLGGLLEDEGNALARPAGQTAARWQVLAAIEDVPRSVAEIARALNLARQSVQRVADALEAAGLVRYADNPRHRRARLVVPTDAGLERLRRIQAEQRPWADRLGTAVGTRDLATLNRLLDRVLDVVQSDATARVRGGGRPSAAPRSAAGRARTGTR